MCQHLGWCTLTPDAALANCMRVASARPTRNGGWLHVLDGTSSPAPAAVARFEPTKLPPRLMGLIAKRCQSAMADRRLDIFARDMGLTPESLRRMGIGWANGEQMYSRRQERDVAVHAFTFPMLDAMERVVGLRLRSESGGKFSFTGGEEGLFIPMGMTPADPLLLCEGPTSCAALLDLGFYAVGRPSCSGGVELVRSWLDRQPRRDVVILGDHDEGKPRPDGSKFYPGQDGARRLSRDIVAHCRSLKVIVPPSAKDARDWKRAGATRAVVEAVIRAANYVRRGGASA